MHPPTRPTQAPTPVVRLLPQLADFAAREYGSTPFLFRRVDAGWSPLTFEDAAAQMHAFTALLEREGVKPGDRVAMQSENRVEWGLAHLAILEAGAVAVPIDALLGPHEVSEILNAAHVTHVITSAGQRAVIEEALKSVSRPVRMSGLDARMGLPSWPDAVAAFPNEPARPERAKPDDLAVLIFTSGTMGNPKGVKLSHANILHNVEALAQTYDFSVGDRLLSVLPLHHTFESTIGFFTPMRVGASVAYARSLKSNELREDLATSNATMILGVPLLYEKLLAAIERNIAAAPGPRRLLVRLLQAATTIARRTTGARIGGALMRAVRARAGFGGMRFFVSGASALPPEVFWGFTDFGTPVLEGYGLTECSPVVTANRPARPNPGGVGPPLPGVEVRIVDPDDEGRGEVAVRGSNVMLGYFEDDAATAEVMHDGWFHTGDLGRVAPDGGLQITGRLKNMIATAAGKKIYPEEIETLLMGSAFIQEVVVLAGRDAKGREEVHAHVVPDRLALEALSQTDGVPFDDAYVQERVTREVEAVCQRLAAYKRVKRVIVRRDEFARTTTGKIRRQLLTAAAPEQGVGAVA